ncbi:hypothetical protein LZ554_005051 [Drepanopeziza brunnea f. sp. 'monogermtubi']|nr:hypothetical protein LZ554_005051 [Drepanopeziza brunnea f. sp. 'monogermtubi']
MLRSQSSIFAALLLALSFFFSGAQAVFWRKKIVIGYTAVPADVAAGINKDHKVHLPESSTSASPRLGPGFYLVNSPDSLTSLAGRSGNWYCAVKAGKKKVGKIPKANIPESYDLLTPQGVRNQLLWAQEDKFIEEYIETRAHITPPEKALRFAWHDREEQLQMAIPTKVLDDEKLLDLWAECFESKEELVKFSAEVIPWDTWQITGDRGQKDWLRG